MCRDSIVYIDLYVDLYIYVGRSTVLVDFDDLTYFIHFC